MNRLTAAVQTIKDSVSALDVGEAIGLEIRHGRCQCPLHGGKDFNCVLYRGDRGFYCHVCHAGGDVIKFTQEYHRMSFSDAVKWLNSTFNLGMDIDSPMSPEAVKRAEIARKTREEEKEFAAWKERMRFDIALTAVEIVQMLEAQRDRNVPKKPNEQWNAKFCEAVRLLPEAKRFAHDCMMDCMKER